MIKQTELSQTHYRALLYYQYKMSGSPKKLHDHWHNTKHYVGQELMNHQTNETITIKSIICIIEFMEQLDQWHDHGDNHKGECNDFQILSFGCQQKEFTYTRLGYNEGGVWFHL